ncbi:MAG: cyclomaltodextrinase [Alphaproteobacteria bacterium]|nr:cyclomaltodextrinase [Alphaproteobacteria bacterium]
MWADSAVFYHIYPLGFCDSPLHNDRISMPQNRLSKIIEWIPHLKSMNVNAVYLGPLFESVKHGYDTNDYFRVDRRLGCNNDLVELIKSLHHNDIRVILDGVFNHVGRNFFAFADVRNNKQSSAYCDWFKLDFTKDNHFHDGFCYEGWDGCDDIVKLNLKNKDVQAYLLEAVSFWIKKFDIDGLRLDVAGYLNRGFIRRLHNICLNLKSDFWLLGEMVTGNYKKLINVDMLHSVTNYELYKALYSSCNCQNLGELSLALNRQFNRDIGVYKDLPLYSFLDNHDVSRIATILKDKRLLKVIYGLLFTLPGVPSIYYGSEWGIEGCRKQGDEQVRPCAVLQEDNDLSSHIAWWADYRRRTPALHSGSYVEYHVSDDILVFARRFAGHEVVVGANIGQINHEYDMCGQKCLLPAQSISLLKY